MKNGAFVFSSTGFLLIIPAVILAASFLSMMGTGDKASILAMGSDTVYYAFDDIRKSFETTSCNLVAIYDTNVSDIRRELNTTWAQYIEQDYAKKTGVNVSIPEDRINVSYNSLTTKIEVGNLDTGQGIPVNVTNLGSTIVYEGEVGPLALSIGCEEETIEVSRSVPCDPSDLIVTIISPSNSFVTDNCGGTTVNISATVQDTCGTSLVNTDAVVTASFSNGDASINLTDTDGNGVYTADWSPSNAQTPTEITVTATGTGTWDGMSDSASVGSGTCATRGMVVPCSCTITNITTCILYPSTGYTTDNCLGTRASVTATVQDNCGAFLTNPDVVGGVLTTTFSNGDGDITLPYSSGNFSGTWDPDTAQNPTTITVESNGTGTYPGISDTDNVSVGVTACGCTPTDIVVNITSPSGGFSTDNCITTSVTISATVKDDCGATVPVTDGTLTTTFSNGDANLSLIDLDGDGIYTADWTPVNIANPTIITVSATGRDDWEDMNDTDSVSGAVANCSTAECSSCDGSFPDKLKIGISEIDSPCLNSSANIVFEMKAKNEDSNCPVTQIKYKVECKSAVSGGCPDPKTLQEGYFDLNIAPGADITTAKQAWITGVDLTNIERIKLKLDKGKYCEGTEISTQKYDSATKNSIETATQTC